VKNKLSGVVKMWPELNKGIKRKWGSFIWGITAGLSVAEKKRPLKERK
jgi:hypothetical protein